MKNLLKIFLTALLFVTISSTNVFSAKRYWIATSEANWNSTSNWSTTSGGSGGSSVPGTNDTVYYDGNGTGRCNINATASVKGFFIQSGYTDSVKQGSAYAVTIGTAGYNQADGVYKNYGTSGTVFTCSTFNLTGGVFVAPSSTMCINLSFGSTEPSVFYQTGGTFTHNNGQLTINCTHTTAVYKRYYIEAPEGTEFYDVYINAGTSYSSYADLFPKTMSSVVVKHNLNHYNGYINGDWYVYGNLYVEQLSSWPSTNPYISTSKGNAKIHIVGTGTQEYFGNGTVTANLIVGKTSGTFQAGSGCTMFGCSTFRLDSGTFVAPSNYMLVGGTAFTGSMAIFTHSGGTFSHNDGTVILQPKNSNGITRYIYYADVISSTWFYNLTAIADGYSGYPEGRLSSASGDTVKTSNTFTHDKGYLEGDWRVEGDFIINQYAFNSTPTYGSGNIRMAGSGNQTYYCNDGGKTANLLIEKTGGSVSPGTSILNVSKFSLSSGSFTAPTGNFTISGIFNYSNQTIFTHSGGTFSHNDGTVILQPKNSNGVTRYIYYADVVSSTWFYNLTTIADEQSGYIAGRLSSASGDTVKTSNTFTHDKGYLEGDWRVEGDLVINQYALGSATTASYSYGVGNIHMTGSGNQTYYCNNGGKTANLLIEKTGGSVSPGTSILNVSKFSLSSGNFTAPTGNYTISGIFNSNQTIFTHSGGIFSHNNGMVILQPKNSGGTIRYIYYADVISSTLFYNLTVIAAANPGYLTGKISSANGDTVKTNNSFILSEGYLEGNWNVQGNYSMESSVNSMDANIYFNGESDQNISSNLTTENRINGNIIINKPSGKVYLQKAVTLDQTGKSLTLTKGNIVSTSTYLLAIGDGVTISGASKNSFVEGPMKKTGNDLFEFPLGLSSNYRPLKISAPSVTTDAYSAEYFNTGQTYGSSADVSLQSLNDCEYWNLARNTGTSNVYVTLAWDTNSCNITNLSTLKIGGWDGSTWKDLGNGATTGDTYNGTIKTSNVVTTYIAFLLNKQLKAEAGDNKSICIGSNTTIGGSPTASGGSGSGYTYTWSPSAGIDTISKANPTANPTATTTYTVIVTDGASTTHSDNVVVTVNSLPNVTAAGATICNGSTATITASGANTYTWSNAETGSSVSVNPTITTTYTVTGTDGNGCMNTADTVVTVNNSNVCSYAAQVTTNNTHTLQITCTEYWIKFVADSSISEIIINPPVNPNDTPAASVQEAMLYSGSCGNLALIGTDSNLVIYRDSLVIGNTYYIKLTQLTQTSGYFDILIRTFAPKPNWPIDPCNTVICQNLIINPDFEDLDTINVYSDYNYDDNRPFIANIPYPKYTITDSLDEPFLDIPSWYHVAGVHGPSGDNYALFDFGAYGPPDTTLGLMAWRETIPVDIDTVYSISFWAINICMNSDDPDLQLRINNIPVNYTNVVTTPNHIRLPKTGNWVRLCATWTADTTTAVIGITDLNLAFQGNDFGLDHIEFGTQNFNIAVTPNQTICIGSCATITVSGASTYTWSTEQQGSSISVCPTITTTYYITGTSNGGCTDTASTVVTVYPSPNITVNNDTVCSGLCATLTASGGISYTWNTSATDSSITVCPTANTTYTVTGIDANGCTNTATSVVSVNPAPTITIATPAYPVCKGSCAALTASGGASYTWSTGATGSSVTVCPTVNTTYTVTGTDANGCTNTASTTVTINLLQKPIISGVNNIRDNTIITYTVPSQAGTNYTWDVTGRDESGTTVSPICSTITYTLSNTSAEIPWSTANLTGCNYARIIVTADNGTCTDKDTLYVFPCCKCIDRECDTVYMVELNNRDENNPITTNEINKLASGISSQHIAVFINGDFVVNNTVTMNYCDVNLGPNARILVTHNNQLNVNSSSLFAGCCYMWDGIYLEDNTSNLNVDGTSTVWSLIQDAKNAVVSNGGGIYDIENTIFEKDYKGIVVNEYAPAHQGSVTETAFECSATLMPQIPSPLEYMGLPMHYPLKTRFGIELNNVAEIQVGEPSTIAGGNIFDDIEVGIYSMGSGLTAYNDTFRNILQPTAAPRLMGFGIYSNDNNSPFNTSLYVGHAGGTLNHNPFSNTFTNCSFGIYSMNTELIDIRKNIFNYSVSPYGLQFYAAINLSESVHISYAKQVITNT
ncbi:MAG: hypothetical protein PHD97_04955, partial [Bacteroidales bacterium]|nr:hypothetical protein [Bacteroidales bacterium]